MSAEADGDSQWQQAKAGEAATDEAQDERSVNAVLQLQLFCQVWAAKDWYTSNGRHVSSKQILTSSCASFAAPNA